MRAVNEIGAAGAEHLAGALRKNTTLTTLNLNRACPTVITSLPAPRALLLVLLLRRSRLTAATAAVAAVSHARLAATRTVSDGV